MPATAACVVQFFHEHGSPSQALLLVVLFGVFVRYAVSLGGYSGAGTPPMFGDYEAQRHWMEITIALPLGDWYRQTPLNDLQYWGLDYPPLSAYVSWLCGKALELWEPAAVALGSSRGYETPTSKLFLRLSVLAFDVLLYLPALVLFFRRVQPRLEPKEGGGGGGGGGGGDGGGGGGGGGGGSRSTHLLLLALLQPALILIDHGHFQYNAVSLALALWAVLAFDGGYHMAGAACFSAALNFKTMALYLAPAFFFWLLARALGCAEGPARRVARLGAAVIATFAVHWLPFCLFAADDTGPAAAGAAAGGGGSCAAGMLAVLGRMFPFGRGLFEDKVANLWCSLSLLVKVQHRFAVPALLRASTALTLLLLVPSGVSLLARSAGRPSTKALLVALLCSSLSFFLASFQVHEKSLLLPLLPVTLLLPAAPLLFGWWSALGAFSMFPLLLKDGLPLQYAACQALFGGALLLQQQQQQQQQQGGAEDDDGDDSAARHPLDDLVPAWLVRWFLRLSLCGALVIHGAAVAVTPPARYPDIITMLFAVFSCAQLCVLWLYANVWQWRIATEDAAAAARDAVGKPPAVKKNE